ncbi:cytochrome c oxidase assembly protein [Metabacillus litoralis]|uniref:cytochrome c oxidase assembly protein n=1 Tax=Metabacillus litoralis TaxID=152268 RepID=UPI001CFCC312|nr:cytochrome c oxidase assembly protein [Metabacillus litoralis]
MKQRVKQEKPGRDSHLERLRVMIGDLLSNFSFSAQWNGGVFYFVLLAIVCYLFILPTPEGHTKGKSILFVFGMLLLAFILGGPLNILARMIFRAHIIQMIILFFIVAPLLVYGAKRGMIFKKISTPFVENTTEIMKHPFIRILMFYGLFIIYHFPSVFDYIRMSNTLNYLYLLGLFIASTLLWSTIFTFKMELPNSCQLNKLVLSVNAIIFLGFSSFLVITTNQLYGIYNDLELLQLSLAVCLPAGETIADIPEKFYTVLHPFPPLKEQKIAGGILAVSQMMWLFLPVSFKVIKEMGKN